MQGNDCLIIYGEQLNSRLLIGSALYPSPAVMEESIKASGAQIVTVSLRRQQSAAAAYKKHRP